MSEVINKSGLLPKGRAVLVRPYEAEKLSSIIEMPATVRDRMVTIEQRAVVIAVGPYAWHDEPEPRAQPGDRVLVSGYAGYMATGTADGAQYRFVNDKDIFAQIEVENND
jgi:co-chaperonin GroES (HSP10)